jgi:hypothetical protein
VSLCGRVAECGNGLAEEVAAAYRLNDCCSGTWICVIGRRHCVILDLVAEVMTVQGDGCAHERAGLGRGVPYRGDVGTCDLTTGSARVLTLCLIDIAACFHL